MRLRVVSGRNEIPNLNPNEYFTVEDGMLEEIRALAASGVGADEVAAQIQKKARLGPDLIKYIAKTNITA